MSFHLIVDEGKQPTVILSSRTSTRYNTPRPHNVPIRIREFGSHQLVGRT